MHEEVSLPYDPSGIYQKGSLASKFARTTIWSSMLEAYQKTRICAAEMAVRYAALSACRKVHECHRNSLGGAT